MRTIGKASLAAQNASKPLPVSLFKTSLREWQAKYKAQRSGQTPEAGKVCDQTSRG
jgi:hypothetical protein